LFSTAPPKSDPKVAARSAEKIQTEVGVWIRNERSSILKTIMTKNVGEIYPSADARLLYTFGRFMQKEIGDDYFFYDRTTSKAVKTKRQFKSKTREEIETFLVQATRGSPGKLFVTLKIQLA
jgi:hypothetical protein